MFEPRDTFQRILYLLMAVTLPFTAFRMFRIGEPTVGAICGAWALIAVLHTMQWLVQAVRDHGSAER
jgi:hypothetical protein